MFNITIRAIPLAILLAYLVWLKVELFDWEPASPDPPPTRSRRVVDVSERPYTFSWPARQGERPAPALAGRIEPTDVYAWWWTGDANPRIVIDTGQGPDKLLIDLVVPNSDIFADFPGDGLCKDDKLPLFACRIGHSRIVMERDDKDWDLVNGLLGKRPLPASTKSIERSSVEFWIREDKSSGRMKFMGWDCDANGWHAAGQIIGQPPQDDASSLARHSRCHSPDRSDRQTKRQTAFLSCENWKCTIQFLYRKRLVTIDAENIPPSQQSRVRGMMLINAWETLNRMEANASLPPSVDAAIAEAQLQRKVCQAVSDDALRWLERAADPAFAKTHAYLWEPKSPRQKMEALWMTASVSCLRAGDIAIGLTTTAPRDAESVLEDLTRIYIRLGRHSSDNEALYAAWYATLAAQNKEESLAMAKALAQYLAHTYHVSQGSPDWKLRRARATQLRQLREKLQPSLSDQELAALATPTILSFEDGIAEESKPALQH